MTQADDPPIFRLLNEIGIIEQLARNRFERSLPEGLRISHFIVLNHLYRLGGARSPLRLANAMQVTKGAMTNTLQRLEARRFVRIVDDPDDGRGKLVSLTDEGRAARQSCVESIAPLLKRLSEELTCGEISSALPVLEKLRKYLDANRS